MIGWTQADPLYRFVPDKAWVDPRKANLYQYVMANPMRYVDPDGRENTAIPFTNVRVVTSWGEPRATAGASVAVVAVGKTTMVFVTGHRDVMSHLAQPGPVEGLVMDIAVGGASRTVKAFIDIVGMKSDQGPSTPSGPPLQAYFDQSDRLAGDPWAGTAERLPTALSDMDAMAAGGPPIAPGGPKLGAVGVTPSSPSPSVNEVKYAQRVRDRGVQDPVSHNFPYSFDSAILNQVPVVKKGGYRIFQLPGTMNDKKGVFEIGMTTEGVIDHRFFRPDK